MSLKKFNGDLTTWTPFWDSFKSSIHDNVELTSIDKFNYLNSLLESSAAAAAIARLTLSEANYSEAVAILTKRFGNRQQIVTKHMDALMGLEAVTSNRNLKGLRRLYDLVESHTRSLHSLGIPSSSYGSLLSSVFMNGIAGPTAIETAFGWILSGPVPGLTLEPAVTCLSTVHLMKVDASVCSSLKEEIANLEG